MTSVAKERLQLMRDKIQDSYEDAFFVKKFIENL